MMMVPLSLICFFLLLLSLSLSSFGVWGTDADVDADTYAIRKARKTLPKELLPSSITTEEQEYELDPALVEMKYDIGAGEQTTLVYMDPSLEQMYSHTTTSSSSDDTTTTNNKQYSLTKVVPKFNGLAAKFINLSNRPVTLYWEETKGGKRHEMRHHNPFSSSGTGSFPGHRFMFVDTSDDSITKDPVQTMVVGTYPNNLYYYDPYHVPNDPKQTEHNIKTMLNEEERIKYMKWRQTLLFHEFYFNATGRSYLANYLRDPPRHHMWRADYFGQEHWVTTKETHFVQLPSEKELNEINIYGSKRVIPTTQKRILHQYRDPMKREMNVTLKALSVIPRVFSIPNFLSSIEVAHILKLASGIELHLSLTGDGSRPVKDTTKTRTSYNSWVKREASPIIDAVYRRAADVLRIDESLFRYRDVEESKQYNLSIDTSIAEDLQLVHYVNKQEYAAHHDFGYSKIDKDSSKQGARFATLLLYLNDGMKGGETTFPRWVNGETFKQLKVIPKAGDAILFYSQLPDGNLDDFSQHAALPVTDGEKWLINLWVWDPIKE